MSNQSGGGERVETEENSVSRKKMSSAHLEMKEMGIAADEVKRAKRVHLFKQVNREYYGVIHSNFDVQKIIWSVVTPSHELLSTGQSGERGKLSILFGYNLIQSDYVNYLLFFNVDFFSIENSSL